MYRESRRDGRTLRLHVVRPCAGCLRPKTPGGVYLFTVDRYSTAKFCGACRVSIESARHPHQSKAMRAVRAAVLRGELPRPTDFFCTECSNPATCYDHRDYGKPLSVDPVCWRCNSVRGEATFPGAEKAAIKHRRAA